MRLVKKNKQINKQTKKTQKNLPANAGDTGDVSLIPESGRTVDVGSVPGSGRSLGVKKKAPHSSILPGRTPWTEDPSGLQSDRTEHLRTIFRVKVCRQFQFCFYL